MKKSMFVKTVALFSAISFVLAGCSGKGDVKSPDGDVTDEIVDQTHEELNVPSAQELLEESEKVYIGDESEFGVKIKIATSVDMSDADEELSSVSMDMAVSMDVRMSRTPALGYTKGTAEINMFGMNFSQPLESYEVFEEDGSIVVYELDDDGDWQMSLVPATSTPDATILDGMKAIDFVSSAQNAIVEETASGYLLKADILLSDISELVSGVAEEPDEQIDFGNSVCSLEMTFDSDKALTSYSMWITDAAVYDGGKLKEFRMDVSVLDGSGIVREVPVEVVEAAQNFTEDNEDDMDWEFSFGSEDEDVDPGFMLDESEEDTPDETVGTYGDTMTWQIFGRDYITSMELVSLSDGVFDVDMDNDYLSSMCTLMNFNDFARISENYLGSYFKYDQEDVKYAIAGMVYAGYVDISDVTSAGVSEEELQPYLSYFEDFGNDD